MTRKAPADVLVVGSGPAGLALAGACAARGLNVLCVAPRPDDPWRQNFGAWQDELPAALAAGCVARSYDRALVRLAPEEPLRPVGRSYCHIDTAALQALLARGCAHGVTLRAGQVEEIEASAERAPAGRAVRLASGEVLRAAVVVDASGAGTRHVRRVGTWPPAFQSAYGELLEVDGHPYAPGEMVFMDFGDAHPGDDGPPTFLYALPLSPTLLFVEETSLVRRPACELSWLAQRLHGRLQRLGLAVRGVRDRERCLIPMGTPLPRADQPVIAFGSAASLVHPATGYHLARMLTLAPQVADAIAQGLAQGGPRQAARGAYAALWPGPRRRAWHLYTLGMEVLCALDLHDTRRFLRAFFQAPPALWRGFLDGTLPSAALAQAMAAVFRRAPGRLRLRLLAGSVASPHLWRALRPMAS